VIAQLDIDRDLQLNLYRILQEQLRNITTHSKCKQIQVALVISNQKLKMKIADDGVGFVIDSEKKGIGMSNIKRRAELFHGELTVFSSPGNGCELIILIPLKAEILNIKRRETNSFLLSD
jgi:signal transduction histidine kinase